MESSYKRVRYQVAVSPRQRYLRQKAKYAARNAMTRRVGSASRTTVLRGTPVEHKIKQVDLPPGVYLVNTTPVFTLANFVQPGSFQYQREGQATRGKYLYLTGFFFPIRTRASTDYARVLVVYDRQTNGAVPPISTILASTDQTGAVTSTATDFTSKTRRNRIQILSDIRVLLPPVTVTAGVLTNNAQTLSNPDNRFQFERLISLKGAVTEYIEDASNQTVADMSAGSIYVVTIGSVAAGAEGYSVNYALRYGFDDE